MKRVWNYIVNMWQPVGIFLIAAVIITGLFSYRLSGLVPGISKEEIAGQLSSQNIHAIAKNPINAPYKTSRLIARKIHSSIISERLISGVIAGLAVLLFYFVVRHFSGRFPTALATLMFATSTSLLTYGRLATPNILLLMLLALLACGYHLRFNRNRSRSLLITSFILSLSLYVPGMIYFIIIGAIWQFKAVKIEQKLPKPIVTVSCLAIFLFLLAPLVFGFTRHPGLFREYLGLPTQFPTILNFLKSLAAVPYGIFISAPRNPLFRLGRQPLLDVFASVIFILGSYTLIKRYKLDRLILLGAIFIIAAVYTAISGNYENSFILVPFIYFICAIGIATMLEQWRKTFPLNPLAQYLSIVIIMLAVIISINFQTRRYFIAWPHNTNTRAMFTVK